MENFPYDKHKLKLSRLNDNHLVIGTSSYKSPKRAPTEANTPDSSSLLFDLLHGGSFGEAPPSPMVGGGGSEMRCSPVYRGPVKLEKEEVFVMDELLVGGGAGRRALRASNSSRSLSSMGSGGGGSGGSVNSSPLGLENVCKAEFCRAWEELGSCRLGSNCQFAHGKEELRPTLLSAKKRPEALMYKSFKGTGSCKNLPNSHFLHPHLTLSFAEAASPAKSQIALPAKLECTPENPVHAITKYKEWSPLDDDIDSTLLSLSDKTPSREDVNAYIHDTVYGSTSRKRLPVFLEICPE